MAAIKINGVTYETDSLSDDVKGHLRHLAHIDQEFERLHMKMDVLRIARAEIGARLDNDLLRSQINSAVFVDNSAEKKLDTSA
jgi:hypothetical protein